MNKTSAQTEKNSLRTFFLFCSVVLLLVIGSLSIKLISSIKESIYNPKHSFILGVKANESYSLYNIDPKNRTVSTLTITTNGKEVIPGRIVSVIPDSEISVSRNSFAHFRNLVPSLFLKSRKLTWFDVMRMYLLSNSFEEKKDEISLAELKNTDYSPDIGFNDPEIVDEQVSIGIVNATGQVGVGARLEKVLIGLGGSVISVTTSQQPKDTSVIHASSIDSYTAKRFSSLLHIPLVKASETGVSDIMIVLGKDTLKRGEF